MVRAARRIAWIIVLPLWALAQEPATGTAPGSMPPARAEGARQRAWWNHEAIATGLALSVEQRSRMNEVLEKSLQRQQSTQQQQREARRRFDAAVQQGDLAGARRQAPQLGEAVGEALECRSTIMVDVLAVLTAEQRQKLLAEHSELLRQPWEEDDPRPRPGQRIRARRRTAAPR